MAQELLEEERVAGGLSVQRSDEWGRDLVTGEAREQLAALDLGEPTQGNAGHERLAAQVGEQIGQRMVAAEPDVSVADHDEQPGVCGRAHEVPQQEHRRLVGPVQVVEHEHRGPGGGDPGDQRGDGLEEAVPLGLGIGGRGRRRFGHAAEELRERAGQVLLQAVQPLVQRGR